MRLATAAALAALAWLEVTAAGQEPGSVRESADVSLVEVPVRVVDRQGQPVAGLTAADFTLLDEGRRQEILGFDVIDVAEKGRADAPPTAPAARRRFLILFDFSFARPKTVVAARKAARDFVLESLGERDLAAVATYSVETGVRLLVTFSSDRAQLARAIETLGLEPRRARGDPLQFVYESTTRSQSSAGLTPPGEAGLGAATRQAGMYDHLRAMASVSRARDDEYERGRVRSLLASFRDLGRALDAIEGRKDIIYLSEGFEGRLLVGTEETVEERQWLLQGESWKVDAEKRFGSSQLRSELSDMTELLRRTDCVIHAVDIAGIATDLEAGEGAGHDSAFPREARSSLFDLAAGTGGEVFRNANDLSGQLQRLTRQTSLVYVLAFRPDRSHGEGAYHALKVKVTASGAKLSARAGYFERRGFRQRTPLERSLSAADVVANEIPVSDVPARVFAAPFARTGDGGTAVVPVLIDVPGAAFLAGDVGERTTLEVYVYAVDGQDTLGDFFTQAVGLDVAAGGDRLRAGGVKYFGELELAPGDYRLRTLVRNANTGRMGLTIARVHVPTFSSGAAYLLPPVFLETPSAEWVSVRGQASSPGRAPSEDAFAGLAGPGFVPTAVPRIAAGGSARLCVVAYHFGGPQTAFRIGSQVLASDGRPLSQATVAVLARSVPDADGRQVFLLSFTAPPEIASGRYGLRIFVEDPSTSQARQSWTAFVVP